MDQTQQTYDNIAEDWHKNHQADDWWVEGTDKFISLLSSGAEVLDVGCGGGTKTKYLLEKGLSVTGIDYSKGQIAICQREVSGAEFFVMNMRDVAELGKKFDAVFAQASLLHIPKAEVQEVIKK
ncbi:MAG: class I SAM-dependent methyltransferase [Patescibacteria group bacterium]